MLLQKYYRLWRSLFYVHHFVIITTYKCMCIYIMTNVFLCELIKKNTKHYLCHHLLQNLR